MRLRHGSSWKVGLVHPIHNHHATRIVLGQSFQPEVVGGDNDPTRVSDQLTLQARREPRKGPRLVRTKRVGRPLVTEVRDPWESGQPADDQSRDVTTLRRGRRVDHVGAITTYRSEGSREREGHPADSAVGPVEIGESPP